MCSITIFKDLIPSCIALLAVVIAGQQYFVNKRKLRLDLFEKKYIVFLEFKKLLLEICKNERVDLFYFQQIEFTVCQRKFLFNSDIDLYFNNIVNKNSDLNQLKFIIQPENRISDKEIANSQINQLTETKKWVIYESVHIEKRFKKYLSFNKVL
jgi:hypothetical protein